MGEFNSDDHYIYYRGQEPVRKNGVYKTETDSQTQKTNAQIQRTKQYLSEEDSETGKGLTVEQ